MGRRKTTWTPEIVRQRIKTTQIVNRLCHFILGTENGKDKCVMTPAQVTAALGLLRKSVPDLLGVAHSGSIDTKRPEDLTDAELLDIITGRGAGIAIEADGETESDALH